MKFVNELNPGLVVRDLGVRFANGEAEVDGKTAAELRKLPPELGIREAGKADGEEPATSTGAKPRRARAE